MYQILGGVFIGLAVTLLLLFNGRVAGISGILGGLLDLKSSDKAWRGLFLLGLLLGGFTLKIFQPEVFTVNSSAAPLDYVIAGLLVGFGTLMGSGCTSGHGVCGISRMSTRSIMATVVFIVSGVISVLLYKLIRGDL